MQIAVLDFYQVWTVDLKIIYQNNVTFGTFMHQKESVHLSIHTAFNFMQTFYHFYCHAA